MLTCPLSRLLQKPRSHKTRTAMTEPPMPAQITWRISRCQMSRASASTSSSCAGSASRRATPSTQSSLSAPSSLPNVAMRPSPRRNWPTASSWINCWRADRLALSFVIGEISFLQSLAGFPLYATSAVQHLTCVWYEENTFLFASHPFFGVNLSIIGIAQVDTPTAFLWNAGGQCDRDARRFDAASGIVGTRSLNVRAVCQNASRHVFKAIPLLDEIVPDMVANLVNQFTVRVGGLGDMRGVDNDFASIG